MRVIFKIGFVREPASLSILHAAAEQERAPAGRWFAANLKLESVAAVVALLASMVGMHEGTKSDITALQANQAGIRADLDDINTRKLPKLGAIVREQTVSKDQYRDDKQQFAQTLNQLQTGQQQIYNLLIEERRRSAP